MHHAEVVGRNVIPLGRDALIVALSNSLLDSIFGLRWEGGICTWVDIPVRICTTSCGQTAMRISLSLTQQIRSDAASTIC